MNNKIRHDISIDITSYQPSSAEIRKIMDYRNNGSKVNVKAIKTEDKLFRYYYAACLIGWSELKSSIRDRITNFDSYNILEAIDSKVEANPTYADTRATDQIKFAALFPELSKLLSKNNIATYTFMERPYAEPYELVLDKRNGLCYTCAYRLIINDNGQNIIIDFTNHTNEAKAGGSFGYSIGTKEFSTKTEFIAAMSQIIGDKLGFPLIM